MNRKEKRAHKKALKQSKAQSDMHISIGLSYVPSEFTERWERTKGTRSRFNKNYITPKRFV